MRGSVRFLAWNCRRQCSPSFWDSVKFSVNGQQVASYSRTHMKPEGIVGVRVNHGLNLHVSKLSITKN